MKHLLVILLVSISFACQGSKHADMKAINTTPVEQFDLNRYLGKWYEIARFPHSFEKDLVGVIAEYSLKKNGKVKVVNSGYKGSLSGRFRKAMGKAKLAGAENVGHLKVSFFLFFYSDYYVLELDTVNYEYALVGSSSSNYLWILSRNPHMSENTYQMLLDKAKERGYNLEKLIKVEQKPLKAFEEGKTI